MKFRKLNNQIFLLLLVIFPLFFSSCDLFPLFEQRDRTFTGDPQVEFFPLSQTRNDSSGTTSTAIQLIGPQRGEPTAVNFAVVDDGTTAQQGVHYEITTPSPVTIPDSASSTTVEINILDGDIPAGEIRTLILELQGGDNIEPAENLKTYTLRIRSIN